MAQDVKKQKVVLGSAELVAGIPGVGLLTNKQIEKWLANPANHQVLDFDLPLGMKAGISQVKGIKKNPLTRAKIELGRQLYFDTRLSKSNTVSCASCHHPDEGYGRHTDFGVGIDGLKGGRNSPVSYNRILSDLQFWDGRADSLEAQAVGPIANPIEMGNTHENAVKTVAGIEGYAMQFAKVFPDGVNIDNIGKAIASFERAIVTGPSPYDYVDAFQPFAEMDEDDLADLEEDDEELFAKYKGLKQMMRENPMSESAMRGMKLFFNKEVNCSACHLGANLADEKFHNLGIGMEKIGEDTDWGRFVVTKKEEDKGAFKTPTIRNVALSGPYMHDGSLKTLEEVVEHYAKGGTPNKWLSDKIRKFKATPQDKADLVEFMRACTGSFPRVFTGRLPQ
ncbi:MAG: cytochrome-c peroxidase [Planctomycetaceae bacterium]